MKKRKIVTAVSLAMGLAQQAAYAQFDPVFDLGDLNGQNGFALNGVDSADGAGHVVSAAGDVNGDGIGDVLIGTFIASPGGVSNAGSSYVVFGSTQAFPTQFNLAELNAVNGIVINGESIENFSGAALSSAGDVNADGIDDLIIGAFFAPSGVNSPGRSYVVFGSNSVLANPLNLSSLNGQNGFAINGVAAGDFSGVSVSAAGDVNGDGIDDVIIGASGADPGNRSSAGSSFVVFGSDNVFPAQFNLSDINAVNGFVINGVAANDQSGRAVGAAGDVNGDGIDDLIIGAYYADPNSNNAAGSSYVIFGSTGILPNPFNLSSLNGQNGFVINGVLANDHSGQAISAAGDVNGDGIDDLLIGASNAAPFGIDYSGSSYVVFGSTSGFPAQFNLININGQNGIAIHGEAANDHSGSAVSSAGDVNGDGIEDLIVGAPGTDPDGKSNAGSSYVLFGSSSGFQNPINLANIDGSNGFVINGVASGDGSGESVSAAGDVNGDGIDDLIIGAPGRNLTGGGFVVFGNDGIFNDGFD